MSMSIRYIPIVTSVTSVAFSAFLFQGTGPARGPRPASSTPATTRVSRHKGRSQESNPSWDRFTVTILGRWMRSFGGEIWWDMLRSYDILWNYDAAFFERPCPSEHNLGETAWDSMRQHGHGCTRYQREYRDNTWRKSFNWARLKGWKVERLSLSLCVTFLVTMWHLGRLRMSSDVFGVTLGQPPIAQGDDAAPDGIFRAPISLWILSVLLCVSSLSNGCPMDVTGWCHRLISCVWGFSVCCLLFTL